MNLWAKPGSGKTVTALTALVDMYAFPILVVATKRICELVWEQEAAQWEHLKDVTFANLAGKSPKRREELLSSDAEVFLINYELLPWLSDTLAGDWPFGAIIFDESSKLKHPSTRRFRKLRKWVPNIEIRVGLTGTPRGNSILGLWGQFFMVNATPLHVPLAPTMTHFKSRWFQSFGIDNRIWRPLKGSEKELHKLSKPYAISVPRKTAAKEATVVPVPVPFPAALRKLYAQLGADLEITVEGQRITAIEPGANRGKKLQLCSGAIYLEDGETWVKVHDYKIEALQEVIEELQGAPLLIFYRFRHELARMKEAIPKLLTIDDAAQWLDSGGNMAAHPQSAAHGLNLHLGGCTTSLWFTLPDSQELWEQGNRRLAREGQEGDVIALVLATQDTVEEDLARNLATMGRLQDDMFDATEMNHDSKG